MGKWENPTLWRATEALEQFIALSTGEAERCFPDATDVNLGNVLVGSDLPIAPYFDGHGG
jgi:hypothetical protein